jgi:hypothetical protein
MRLVAEKGNHGLFFITAMLSSPQLENILHLNFCIDTGATLTTISWFDAIMNNVSPSEFGDPLISTDGVGGSVPTSVIRNCKLEFETDVGWHVETLTGVNLLHKPTFESAIGLDILKNYKIYFRSNVMFLEK